MLNRALSTWSLISVVLCITTFAYSQQQDRSPMVAETASFTFQGEASGGSLLFLQTPSTFSRRWAAIKTSPGESAESVAERLSAAIRKDRDVFGWRIGPRAEGASLLGIPDDREGLFVLAGSETGLGIPAPPKSLSARYDTQKDQIILDWENPAGGYDAMAIVWNGLGLAGLSGNITRYVYDRSAKALPREPQNLNIAVVGYRGNLPSNAALIRLHNNIQEEALSVPHTCGVASNWTSWSTSNDSKTVEFIEVRRSAKKLRVKPIFQRIKINQPGVQAGVWRKFLGLVPGHTYRLSAWMSTISQHRSDKDWSYSLHATYLPKADETLTVAQLAGNKPLPTGRAGPEAARITWYRPGVATENKFDLATTDPAKECPGRVIGDMMLPANVETIIVWVRYACDDPETAGVALDHLRLEDLSAK